MFYNNGWVIHLKWHSIPVARKVVIFLLLFFSSRLCEAQFTVTLTPSNYGGFNISCNGASDGSINTTLTGGVAPFTFLWSNGETTQNLTGIAQGIYTVTVTDDVGSQEVADVILVEPNLINISVSIKDVSCHGGSDGEGNISVSGGASPYTYIWSNSETTQNIIGLDTGTYFVTITDLNNCQASTGFDIIEPDSISILSTITNVDCNGAATGSIVILASGGSGLLSYMWSNASTTQNQNNLVSNSYSVTVTDENNCTNQETFVLTQPDSISVSGIVTDITCNNGNNGSINVTANGGTGSLFYLWSNASTNQDQSNLSANTYTITVTDANNCSTQELYNVTQPSILVVTGIIATVSCNGGTNGGINISANGGTGTITYQWSNSSTLEDQLNLVANTYTVTATDANACTTVRSFNVTEPQVVLVTGTITPVSCNGGSDGAINTSTTGGTGNFTYVWSNGSTLEDPANLIIGNYTVSATDVNGCTGVQSFGITEPLPITIDFTTDDADCNLANGSILANAQGGIGTFTYRWNTNAITQSILNLSAGTYTCTATDQNNCSSTEQVSIINSGAPTVSSSNVTNVSCNGQSNGAIDITVSNGTPFYIYLWSNLAITQDISNLFAGNYSCTITDGNLCETNASFLVTQPPVLTAQASVTNVGCPSTPTGSINITPVGGTAPYTFLWNTSSTSEDIVNVVANTYTVTITDANNCVTQKIYTVSQPGGIVITGNVTDVACFGESTGVIDISVVGGTPGYTYQWSNSSTTEDLTNLPAGIYTVTVTDAVACTEQQVFIVSQSPEIIATGVVTNVGCNGASTGAIDLSASGGSGSLSYLWNNSSTTEDITNLTAGIYTVTVTDQFGCTKQESFTVNQASLININGNVTNISCNGLTNGAIDITVTGGAGGYLYLWSNSSTTEDIGNLAVNTYTVTVTDANNCTEQETFNVNEPPPIIISGTVTDVSCNGGSDGAINISVSGGSGGFTYLWNNSSTVDDQVNLSANNYTLTVTDANNCTAQQSFNVAQPLGISITGSITNVSCNGGGNGAIDITATGGTGSFTYLWNNSSTAEDQVNLQAGVYTATVTDGNNCTAQQSFAVSEPGVIVINGIITDVNCNGGTTGAIDITVTGGTIPYSYLWNNSSTSEDLTNLAANTYTVTVTDFNGCTGQQSFVVNQSLPVSITSIVSNVSCNGGSDGSINITTSGGTGGYTYLWSNASTVEDQNGLSANTYTVTATDNAGCTGQQSFVVTEPSSIVINGTISNVSCNGGANGAIDITVSGGTGTYTFLWNTSSTVEDQVNLAANNYTVTVTDVNNCSQQQVFAVNQPLPISTTFNNVDASCNQNNGSSTVIPSGGNGGYTYLWSTSSTDQTINNLAPGTYTVTVTDVLLCSNIFTTTINAISGLDVSLNSITNVRCNGGADGAIDISVTNGTPPYLYLWSNLQISQDISGVTAGLYIVTVTDLLLCTQIDSFIITEPATISANFNVTNAACSQANGSVTVVASGGTFPYSYMWSNGFTTDNINSLLTGTYTVIITDAHNCVDVFTVNVGDDPGPSVVIDSVVNVDCFGTNTGDIYITASGGTPPLQYLWSNSFTTDDINGVNAGTYTVTVTDFRGCTTTITTNVNEPALLNLSMSSTAATCNSNNGSVQVVVSGGILPYTYLWNTNDITDNVQNLFSGIYTVTVTDFKGCSSSDTVSVGNAGVPQITTFNQTNVSCNGGNNGSVTIIASGGIGPYTYQWSNGDVDSLAEFLSANTYTVTVTDFAGCSSVASYTITQPLPITLQFFVTPEPCNNGNGAVAVIPSGGASGFTYLWSTNDTTFSINNLVAGSYTVTVTDQNNCSTSGTAVINSINAPDISVTSVINLLCNGSANGAIDITVTGGVQPYTYSWSNSQTTEDINNLPGGTYTVIVSDLNNCVDSVSIQVSEPGAIVVGFNVTPSFCNNSNGSITTNVSGGTPGYTYLWSTNSTTSGISNVPAAVYTLTITDANNCQHIESIAVSNIDGPTVVTQSIQSVSCNGGGGGGISVSVIQGTPPFSFLWSNGNTTQDLTNVSAGIYFLTVTDSFGCVFVFSDTVPEPPAMSFNALLTNATCNLDNGIITVTPVGGTFPYLYTWSTGDPSSTISGLSAGITYTVTVTDSNNCVTDSSFSLINSGSPVINVNSVINVRCFGGNDGSIDIGVSDGVSPYQFNWSNNTQSEDVQNLIAGVYTITVTDQVGCTTTQIFNIVEPLQISITFPFVQDANCNQANGLVAVNVIGGIPGYSLLWSNNSTNDTITGLIAGSYVVTVTDTVGCVSSNVANVSNINGPSIIDVDSVNVSCPGGSNGSITISATGGTGSLSYTWTNNPSTTPSINNLGAGTYTVTVRDAANCLTVRSVTITEPLPFNIASETPLQNPPFNLSCFESEDGIINLNISGGTAPYLLIWSNGSNEDSLQNLSANVYTVLITDANQCTTSDTFALTQPPQLVANAGTNFTICGENQTTLTAIPINSGIGFWQVLNGNDSIIFTDSTAATTVVSNLPEGDNTFLWTVTDGVCFDSSIIVVTTASNITAIPGTDRIICATSTSLDATRPQFGNAYWQLLNGSAVILDTTNAFTGVQNLSVGANVFMWIVSNGSCRDTGVITITRRDSIECLSPIQVPTAFSPNSDGHNDFFEIKGIQDYAENDLLIYNRWGKVVYQWHSYQNQWNGLDDDGKELPDGTYFVILRVKGIPEIFKTFVDLRR